LWAKTAQQSVHLTLGILRTSQAFSYALSFFWLDGFAVPAPAQVTQTVRRWCYEVQKTRVNNYLFVNPTKILKGKGEGKHGIP
jgi:hypothetical protein